VSGDTSRGETDRQLPIGDEIFLDHVGHFVPDPDAASRALARAGFAPTAISIQVNPDGSPTGTGNVTAMLRRGYLEVLFKTADTQLSRELDAAISRYPGIHLAAFSVADASATHSALESSGFDVRPLVEMQRPVKTETGSTTAAFTVTRVAAGAMPEGRIQLLTHLTEHTVWQPRWLRHPNGAIGLLDLLIVVADVEEAAERFARFTRRPANSNRVGRRVRLDRGGVQLISTKTLSQVLPGIHFPSLPFVAAYGVAVRSLDTTEKILRKRGFAISRHHQSLMVNFPVELGHGAWLFVQDAIELPWLRT
jgi:hypothetical protein